MSNESVITTNKAVLFGIKPPNSISIYMPDTSAIMIIAK